MAGLGETGVNDRQLCGESHINFSIFVDEDTTQHNPSEEKRPDGRVPLSSRSDFANSSPLPPHQTPILEPEHLPEGDPTLENIENLFSEPYAMPTATLPIPTSNINQPDFPITANAAIPPSTATTEPVIRDSRVLRAAVDLVPPMDPTLYWLLGISDWHASTEDISLAYRRIALYDHPDRVPEFLRGIATERMQRINGARAVLSDRERHTAYHRDGRLP